MDGTPATVAGPAVNAQKTATASCPAGTMLVGGGARIVPSGRAIFAVLQSSFPSSAATWSATGIAALLAGKADTMTVTAYALCTLPGAAPGSATAQGVIRAHRRG